MTRVAVALALAAVVALVAVWLQRRRPSGPAPTRHHVPTVVARADFARPEATWLVVVFTSASCSTCAETWEAARALASDTVAVEEAEVGARPDLHERYGIDAVPTTIVADATGAVRASFLGPASPDHLRSCVSWKRLP